MNRDNNDTQSLLFKQALEKLQRMSNNEHALQTFLEHALFGWLKEVADILLEPSVLLKGSDFFKSKKEGGIFEFVEYSIFQRFDFKNDNEIRIEHSYSKHLKACEITEISTEEKIIGEAKINWSKELGLDFGHIKQICERHLNGEEILKSGYGSSNVFWVRDKNAILTEIHVFSTDDGQNWSISKKEVISGYSWNYRWNSNYRYFFNQ